MDRTTPRDSQYKTNKRIAHRNMKFVLYVYVAFMIVFTLYYLSNGVFYTKRANNVEDSVVEEISLEVLNEPEELSYMKKSTGIPNDIEGLKVEPFYLVQMVGDTNHLYYNPGSQDEGYRFDLLHIDEITTNDRKNQTITEDRLEYIKTRNPVELINNKISAVELKAHIAERVHNPELNTYEPVLERLWFNKDYSVFVVIEKPITIGQPVHQKNSLVTVYRYELDIDGYPVQLLDTYSLEFDRDFMDIKHNDYSIDYIKDSEKLVFESAECLDGRTFECYNFCEKKVTYTREIPKYEGGNSTPRCSLPITK